MSIIKNALLTVSLVIVTRNRPQYLKRTLESICAQNEFEKRIRSIVVVDNASTDETPVVLEDFKRRLAIIQVIRTKENIGGSGGFALGIKSALQTGSDWIGLCDDDVALEPDAVENIFRYAEPHFILGCLRLDRKGFVAERASRYYNLVNPFILNPRRGSLCKKFKFPYEMKALESVAFSSFEGMFFSVELIHKIGLPSAEFFIFGDDCDFCLRAAKIGWKVFIVREAKLTRLIDYDSSSILHSWKSYYVLRNFFVLHLLHGENIFVRSKPFFLVLLFMLYDQITGVKINPVRALFDALRLSRTLKKSTFFH